MIRMSFAATGLLCCGLLLSTGCSKQSSKPGKKTRSAQSNHERIQGSWGFDVDRMKTLDPKWKKMSPGDLKTLRVMVEKMKMKFTKDKVISEGGRPSEPKPYRVLSDKGNTLQLETTEGKGWVAQVTAVFHSNRSVTLTVIGPGGQKEIFALKR